MEFSGSIQLESLQLIEVLIILRRTLRRWGGERTASLEFKTNGFQLPPVGSAASAIPALFELSFVGVRHALALTARRTETSTTAMSGRFKLTNKFATPFL